jgi:8-oxo-dGTP diphosphatase
LTIQATLCFILKDNKILLLRKSKGLLGQGKWNAPGGKMLSNEAPKACAIREVFEETRLIVTDPKQVGKIYFYNNGQRSNPVWTVHVFLSSRFDGVPIDGREGHLKWFGTDALPFDEMWEDDRHWYQLALGGTRFEGWFYYSGDFEKLIDHKIETELQANQVEA